MKIFRLIVTRLNIIIFLLVLQAFIAGAIIFRVFSRFPLVWHVGVSVSIVVFLSLVKKDKPAAFKLTWVIVVLSFLPLGGLLYLFFGDKRPTSKTAAHVDEHALIAKHLERDDVPDVEPKSCGRMANLFGYVRDVSSYHAYPDTAVDYYNFGEHMFAEMLVEMQAAKRFIFLEYFIIYKSTMWDQILEILVAKVTEGVDVRLIIDDFGSMKLFTNAYIRKLRAQGIKIVRFNPMRPLFLLFMNNRDHRKILVIDGHTAFNGGMNIADEYINVRERFGVWKDTGVRLKGAAVWSFTLMFIEMWDTFCKQDERINDYETYRWSGSAQIDGDESGGDGLVLPFGDSPLDDEQTGENVYIDMLNQAQHYVYIFTPYLIISEKMIYALQMAAKRGVDVRIVTPGIPDKKLVFRLTRSYYRFLLSSGVKIYEYTPGFMHAKSFVCDDIVAAVGTINLDYRSLYLHFECATLIYNTKIIDKIKQDAIKTINISRQVHMNNNRKQRLIGAFVDSILHLFSPLM